MFTLNKVDLVLLACEDGIIENKSFSGNRFSYKASLCCGHNLFNIAGRQMTVTCLL